ncbi:hypothetical protein KEM56_003406 [Ascosphaera pollenicola]|nr:hypothetical protein KEM56_003406 [Ascosphaera pollenicola]
MSDNCDRINQVSAATDPSGSDLGNLARGSWWDSMGLDPHNILASKRTDHTPSDHFTQAKRERTRNMESLSPEPGILKRARPFQFPPLLNLPKLDKRTTDTWFYGVLEAAEFYFGHRPCEIARLLDDESTPDEDKVHMRAFWDEMKGTLSTLYFGFYVYNNSYEEQWRNLHKSDKNETGCLTLAIRNRSGSAS